MSHCSLNWNYPENNEVEYLFIFIRHLDFLSSLKRILPAFAMWWNGLRNRHCSSCGIGGRCSSDSSLAQELSFGIDAAKKEKEKKKKERFFSVFLLYCFSFPFDVCYLRTFDDSLFYVSNISSYSLHFLSIPLWYLKNRAFFFFFFFLLVGFIKFPFWLVCLV